MDQYKVYNVYNIMIYYAKKSKDIDLKLTLGISPKKLTIDNNLEALLNKVLITRYQQTHIIFPQAFFVTEMGTTGMSFFTLKKAGPVCILWPEWPHENKSLLYYHCCTGKQIDEKEIIEDESYLGVKPSWPPTMNLIPLRDMYTEGRVHSV
jgi:hypothetical protein